jgi:hypothetical protein
LILTEPKKAAPRGRPRTGTAKTSTARGKAADDALLAAGGRIVRARLSPDAAAALDILAECTGMILLQQRRLALLAGQFHAHVGQLVAFRPHLRRGGAGRFDRGCRAFDISAQLDNLLFGGAQRSFDIAGLALQLQVIVLQLVKALRGRATLLLRPVK